ncbi:two pore segment channel 3 isoform X1 [Dunckerocampus dactyliophorus]|uniref:two pore segment channel 3 isoform X1 n=1 Tax=Dunckerocampus dactyliophorus TaxID=161453 RepID=UPI0024072650|nr:two pore segment channel 3 isoform X1 [Dunckerocampus dactyliophorus]
MTSTSSGDARACAGKENANEAKNKADFDLAAVYVSDAQYNRNIFFDTSPQAVRLYLLYNHRLPQVLIYFFILLHLSLAICEEPAVLPLPPWATMLVELLCLHVFALRLVHYAKVIPRDKFWKDPKNICMIVILALTLVDMIIYGALHAAGCYAVRWSRVLRPLLLVNVTEGRQLRRAFRSIRNALPQILYVFLLFIFSILVFSLMALKLFSKRGLRTVDGAPYFTNYVDVVFDLYVLVTTANSPDVMMPAYNASSAFAIFFIVYILVNTYIFMSVFLAVVFNNYKKYLKEEVRQLVRAKRHKMARAFAVLQERTGEGGEPRVSRASWTRLIRLVQPDISHAHIELLWSVSDDNNCGAIDKTAFIQLADLLNIEVITLKSRPHPLLGLIPALYLSAPSRFLCRLVQHRAFVITYDVIILVNAVFIGLDEESPVIANSEWVFLALYLLEILLKLYVCEPRSFFSRHNFWNCGGVHQPADPRHRFHPASPATRPRGGQHQKVPHHHQHPDPHRTGDPHLWPAHSGKKSCAVPSTLSFVVTRAPPGGQVVYYIFAMVGMELFKGKVKFYEDESNPAKAYCGNLLLKGSAFAQLNYCKNNFNNVVSSFILLLELTVVNQWHVLSNGFATVTHVSARIYFVLFHIVVVIIIINIFVAFVLEAFFVEYSVDKSDLQTSLEKKIEELELGVAQETAEDNLVNSMETCDNEQMADQTQRSKPNLMFKIASKRYRTVDALLQRLFEADLEQEDNADADADPQTNGNFSNPTFSTA